ncbi:MAG TPA: hypothetical protein VG826_00910 [Pirellulales bacterium]|nr:hypothetical protein [Pirellulales bacterium]
MRPAGKWQHGTLAFCGGTLGEVTIGLQHDFAAMSGVSDLPPREQAAQQSMSSPAVFWGQQSEAHPEGADLFAFNRYWQKSLSRPLEQTQAVLGMPAHAAKGIITHAVAADSRFRTAVMPNVFRVLLAKEDCRIRAILLRERGAVKNDGVSACPQTMELNRRNARLKLDGRETAHAGRRLATRSTI